ncbi:MAG: hypothetical protein Fur0034_07170 [Desulfuromonadia bacterium]
MDDQRGFPIRRFGPIAPLRQQEGDDPVTVMGGEAEIWHETGRMVDGVTKAIEGLDRGTVKIGGNAVPLPPDPVAAPAPQKGHQLSPPPERG